MLFTGKLGTKFPQFGHYPICHYLSTIRHYSPHSRLFATIRDCSPLFALFETIRTIRDYSLLGFSRQPLWQPCLHVNSCCRYFHNFSEKHLQFSDNYHYWETLKSTKIKCIWSSSLHWSQLKWINTKWLVWQKMLVRKSVMTDAPFSNCGNQERLHRNVNRWFWKFLKLYTSLSRVCWSVKST